MLDNSKIEALISTYGDRFIKYYNIEGYSLEQIATVLDVSVRDANILKIELQDKLISSKAYQERRKECIKEQVKKAIEEGKSLDKIEGEIAQKFYDKRYYKKAIKEILTAVYTDQIKVLYEKGNDINQIAEKLKISADIVKIIFQRLEYIKYYNKGYNLREIARELKITPISCKSISYRLSSYHEKVSEKEHRDNRREHIIDTVIKRKKEQASYSDLLNELCIESIEEKEFFYRTLKDHYEKEYLNIPENEKPSKSSKPSKPKTTVQKGKSSKRKEEQEEHKKQEEQKKQEDKQNSVNAVYSFFIHRISTGKIIPDNIDDLNIEFKAKSEIKEGKSAIQAIVERANRSTKKKQNEKPTITVARFLNNNDTEYIIIVQNTYRHVQEILTLFEKFKDNNNDNTHLTLADSIYNMSLQDRLFIAYNLRLWLNSITLESLKTEQLKGIEDIINKLPRFDTTGDGEIRIKVSDTLNKTLENMLSQLLTKVRNVIEDRNNLFR